MTAFPSSNPIVQIKAELAGGDRITVNGRDAWALSELIAGGMIGVTPLHNPAPRWSHYIFKLRKADGLMHRTCLILTQSGHR
jgi:hypothetical protein